MSERIESDTLGLKSFVWALALSVRKGILICTTTNI